MPLAHRAPRVFVSYSHESDAHAAAVQEVAITLRVRGIEVLIDVDVEHPAEGWAQWALSQLTEADAILMVCSETYKHRIEQRHIPGQGRGATWEAMLLHDIAQDAPNAFGKIALISLESQCSNITPNGFQFAPSYRLPSDYDRLLEWLIASSQTTLPHESDPPEPYSSPLEQELLYYTNVEERSLAAYLHDLEELRLLDGADYGRRLLEERIGEVRRHLRRGPMLEVGCTLGGGRYRLESTLGTGGFGTVWLATDATAVRSVAIKVLKPEHVNRQTLRDRFFRGARVMATFEHPNIVHILDGPCIEQGHHFFVMEYLSQGDLHSLMKKTKPAQIRLLSIVGKVAAALTTAHQRGFIHRDVKPANILLDANGEPQLSDFDLVYAPDSSGGTQAEPMGTYLYSSPEVLTDPSGVDGRADVYSLAMTLLFCLRGGDLSIGDKHRVEHLVELLSAPVALQQLIADSASSDPARRPQTMGRFEHELRRIGNQFEDQLGEKGSALVPAWAALRSLRRSGRLFTLPSVRSLVGRGDFCDLRLETASVSEWHASISRIGAGWILKDMGSLHGTYVDQQLIRPRQIVALRVGVIVAFAEKSEAWEFVADGTPPELVAISRTTGETRIPTDDRLCLPSDECKMAEIYRDPGRGWLFNQQGRCVMVNDGDRIEVDGAQWLLRLNAREEPAATAPA